MSAILHAAAPVAGLPDGMLAWTTTRDNGSFGLGSEEPVGEVMARWSGLQTDLQALGVRRLATAHQVHGAGVRVHASEWDGWLRGQGVDGHITWMRGTALAVTVADCTPVFVAHAGGAIAVLHAGWRGTAGGILDTGLDALARGGFPPEECHVHLGPAICGPCYEVGPEVLAAVTGALGDRKGHLDVRAVLAEQAHRRRVASVTTDGACTRCDRDRFFSHRGGDSGRQLGVMALRSS